MLTVEKSRSDDMDDLDAYMMSIKSGGMNATGKSNVWCTALQIDSRDMNHSAPYRHRHKNDYP